MAEESKDRDIGAQDVVPKTILVADDEPSVRKIVTIFLEAAGYRVLTAGDGAEALRLIEERGGEIDLALLDVVMPRLGGREVFTRMGPWRDTVRILLTSGYAADEVDSTFTEQTGIQLIQKPYRRDALLRAVRETLERPPRPLFD
jgi:DNA-binding response OmpR family regulator